MMPGRARTPRGSPMPQTLTGILVVILLIVLIVYFVRRA